MCVCVCVCVYVCVCVCGVVWCGLVWCGVVWVATNVVSEDMRLCEEPSRKHQSSASA